ncbi:MAG TPA: AMP-binding protein [Rubrobacter sp.]|nr:AMP-binding protein [Rubrobacter sp.]
MPRPEFTLHDLLHNTLERDPQKLAVVDGDAQYTYEDLERESGALGAALIDAGVGKGDRVGVLVEKSWEAIVSMLAASRIGAAYVNVNPLFKAPQIEYLAGDCDIRVMIGDTGKLDELQPKTVQAAFYRGEKRPQSAAAESYVDVAEALSGDGLKEDRAVSEIDLGTILYTSGSTGMPKGVATSQRNVVVGSQIVTTYLENVPEDRILSALPLNFDAGMSQFTTSLRAGATLYLLRSRLPGDLLKALRRHEITGVTGVPPLWALLIRSAKSLRENPLSHLRYLANTGGRIPQANLDELRNLLEPAGTKIYLMYGLTEAFRSTYLDPDEIHRSSPEQGNCIGKAIPNTEIMVIDKEGNEAAPGEPGELVHRGPTVAMGYWGNEEATRKAYRPNPLAPPELLDVERVVYSGDTVTRDEEGFLYFLGREDAMIKNQGYRLSPEEVENLLLGSGLVHEACAFGVENPAVGHDVIAVISLKGGGDGAIDSIREYAINNGPPYMIPKEIIVRDELPKNANGKIDRKGISSAYTNG